MSTPDPDASAAAWLSAFNAHDVEGVLAHFAEDVVFTSPVAARTVPTTGGVVAEVLTFGADGLVVQGHGTYLR